jgi:hypothetical protein
MPWMSTSGNPSPHSSHLIGTSIRRTEMPSTLAFLSMLLVIPHVWNRLAEDSGELALDHAALVLEMKEPAVVLQMNEGRPDVRQSWADPDIRRTLIWDRWKAQGSI